MPIVSALLCAGLVYNSPGQSTRYPAELQEKNKLFSATRTFFQAPCSTTGRRALSLDPGLSYYADQDEFTDHPRRSSSSPTRDRPSPTPRGRERGRGRIGADEHNSQHDPQEDLLRSLPALDSSLVSEIVPPLNSPPHHHADERHVSYDDNLFERPRSRSRGRMSARFSFATMSSSILQAVLGVSSKESRGDDHSQPPGLLRHLGEPVSLDSNEQTSDDIGNGWQEFKKGMAVNLNLCYLALSYQSTCREIHVSHLFRSSLADAPYHAMRLRLCCLASKGNCTSPWPIHPQALCLARGQFCCFTK